jgi:putative glycerol-1-phosphate prenyltransferase
MLGNKLIYLEAGSGPKISSFKMINLVAQNMTFRFFFSWWWYHGFTGIQNAYDAGADLVVIGTAFENNIHFFL